VSYYRGAFLRGAHNFKVGYEGSRNKNGNFYDINQDINVFLNNGVPLQVQIFNTPVREQSIFHEQSLFLQDAWTLSRRITVNVGVRFDHFRAFNPSQCSPKPAIYTDLFPTRCFSQSTDVVNWNNAVPRLSAAWDPTGKGRSVVRGGYNRFVLSEGTRLAEAVNPNSLGGNTYRWNDLNADGVPQANEFLTSANFLGSFGGIVTRIDPNLERPYSDPVNIGYEQQVFRDLRAGVSYYHRTTKRQISRRNMAALPADYTSITTLSGAPITNPLTGVPLTLYNLNPEKVGKVDLLITNVGALDDNDYNAVEFTAVKRFTNRWQVLAGFTLQRYEGTLGQGTGDDFNNPNRDINRNGSRLDQDSTHIFKIDTTYQWPYRISTSLNFQHYTGYPLLPTNLFRGLNQNTETVKLAPNGTLRLDSVDVANLRIARPTLLMEGRLTLEPLVDLFNLTNNNPVLARATSFGPVFLRPSDVLNPFVARFGLKINF